MQNAGTTLLDERGVEGVVKFDSRGARNQRLGALALAVFPLAGVVAAVVLLWGRIIHATDLVLMITFYLVTGLGITVGYHRLLTHRSFTAPRWLKLTFAVLGSGAIEGSVVAWVADHRRHHAYADKEGDPHSPHLEEGLIKGLWHAHMGWLFKPEATDAGRWAPDLARDPAFVRVEKLFPAIAVGFLVLPALLGGLLTWSLVGAVTGFVWGGLVRAFVLHHVTFSINSICHVFGRRPYETSDRSTNNWPLALISFGESWHNNHHAFPTSAFHGLKPTQVDVGGILIRTLERVGLAQDVKRPTERQRQRITQEG